jgi:hypothetical protein
MHTASPEPQAPAASPEPQAPAASPEPQAPAASPEPQAPAAVKPVLCYMNSALRVLSFGIGTRVSEGYAKGMERRFGWRGTLHVIYLRLGMVRRAARCIHGGCVEPGYGYYTRSIQRRVI